MDFKSLVRSPISIRNHDLNFSTDISCKNAENGGGKIFSGISINGSDKNKINHAACSNINVNLPIKNYSIGTQLNESCDCEIRNLVGGEVKCPEGKFVKSYYPNLKKVTCCSPCIESGNIKGTNNNDNCMYKYAQIDKTQKHTNLTCPNNSFIRGFGITENTAKIECCDPALGGSYAVEQSIMKHRCDELGISESECTQKMIDQFEDYCKKYNIYQCDNESIEKYKNSCYDYGFKYRLPNGKTKNLESTIDCHNDLIHETKKDCAARDLPDCTIQNLNSVSYNTMNAIRRVLINPFVWLSTVVLLLILIIYLVYNNKKSNQIV